MATVAHKLFRTDLGLVRSSGSVGVVLLIHSAEFLRDRAVRTEIRVGILAPQLREAAHSCVGRPRLAAWRALAAGSNQFNSLVLYLTRGPSQEVIVGRLNS